MLKTTGASLAFAYNLQINNIQFVSASIDAGYFRRQANLNNLTTGSQYVPNQGYDPNLPINETFNSETKGYLDLSSGVVWQLTETSGATKAFIGISAFHLNQPDVSLNDEPDALAFRYGFQAGFKVYENEKLSVFPDAGMDYQAKLLRYNIGINIKVPFKGMDHGYMKNANLIFKPRYLSDKIASFGLEFKKPEYIISFMYDFSIANSAVNSNVVNAYEFQIGYTKNLFKPKQDKKKIIMDDQYIVGDERILNKPKELIIIRDTIYVEDTIKIAEKGWSEKLKDPERKITFNYKSEKFEEEAKNELDEIVRLLKSNADYVIEIEGHTDNIGNAESNKRQSLRRAQAISDYLENKEISKSRIRVNGLGASQPTATNATEEGRAKNRRVEFRLYKLVK